MLSSQRVILSRSLYGGIRIKIRRICDEVAFTFRWWEKRLFFSKVNFAYAKKILHMSRKARRSG